MRVLFLNQYFPPDPAPTGVLLAEIAAELKKAGHQIDFVAARQDYRAAQKQGGRMIREARALLRMLWDGLGQKRPDVVISATSPPCLLVVATLIAFWHRARSVHWIMDLYPEIAVALGEVREGPFARFLGAVMGWCYRRAARVVVLDEDMARCLRRHGIEPVIVRPWVFSSTLQQLEQPDPGPLAEWTWIYSGNLGRAHEWETLLAAQAEIERRGASVRLLFQGGGPSWPRAQERAGELGLRQIEWRGYAPESELAASFRCCHALVVTQLPAAQGLLWPSKLGFAMSLPRWLVFVGPPDGAIADSLRPVPRAGIFAPGEGVRLAEWLIEKSRDGETIVPSDVFDAAAHRAAALAEWKNLLA